MLFRSRHLMQAGEALSGTLNSIHNLAYYLGIMERVRRDLHPGESLRTRDAQQGSDSGV